MTAGTTVGAAGLPARARPRGVIAVLAAEGFLTRLGFGMVNFTLPLFALSMGMSIAEIGLLGSIRGVSILAIKPVVGRLAVRFGAKPIFLNAILGRVVTSVLLALSWSPIQLIVLRVLHGASVAARDPTAASLLATYAPPGRLARSFAWYTTAKDVGGALGYGAAGLTLGLTANNYRAPFMIAGLTSAAAFLLAARYLPSRSAAAAEGAAGDAAALAAERDAQAVEASPTRERPRGPSRLMLSIFGAAVGGTAQMLYGLFPVLAVKYAHLSEAETGIILTASAGVLLVSGPGFAWISDRFGRHFTLFIRAAANAISSLVYLLQPNLGGVAGARLLDDAGKAAFRPTWGALMTDDAGKVRSAAAIADLDTAYSLGETVGPLLAGWLWQMFGIGPMLITRAVLALATELFGWLAIYGRRPPSD